MSHHYSGPDFGFPHGDARLDFTDLFAFPKPGDASKSILIMDMHPSSGVNPPGPSKTLSRQAMIGKTAKEVFPEAEAKTIEARDEDLLRSGTPLFDEREMTTPQGSVRSISSLQPGITRVVSRSSMRSSQRPPALRASRKLPSAATSEPRCSAPVGEGAKRPI